MAAYFTLPRLTPVSPRPSLLVCLFILAWVPVLRISIVGATDTDASHQKIVILLAGLLGAGTVIAIHATMSWAHVRATHVFTWVTLYAAVMVPAAFVFVTTLILGSVHYASASTYAGLSLAMVLTACGLGWVVDETVLRWRATQKTRSQLQQLVSATENFNQLLTHAELTRFHIYSEQIHDKVMQPLTEIVQRSAALPDGVLADELDALVSGTMRPLSHLLHPVSVRVGLISAMRALGGQFELIAEPDLLERDAAGTLLDPNVRLQVYRWSRNLASTDSAVRITLDVVGDHLRLRATNVTSSRDLDPIQQIAGLRLMEPSTLLAPLQGVEAIFEPQLAPDAKSLPERAHVGWRELLTTSPVMKPGVVAVVAVVTAPGQAFLDGFQANSTTFLGLIVAIAIPTILASTLSGVPIRSNSTRGALTALGLWTSLGVISAVIQFLTLTQLGTTTVDTPLVGWFLVRGISRYLIPGVLWMTAHALTKRAQRDNENLAQQLDELRHAHREILAIADGTDRFVAETLHRSIQGRLSAAALMLRLNRSTEARAEVSTLLETTIPELIARLDNTNLASVDYRQFPLPAVPEIAGLRIVDTIDWAALGRRSSPVTLALRRALAENAANAARHGQATHVESSAHIGDEEATVTSTDNGVGFSADTVPGLGSRLCDEMVEQFGGRWSVTRLGDSTVFSMTLRYPAHL
ncbi:MAG: ATP-binding protein [Actinomycetes bacterium]